MKTLKQYTMLCFLVLMSGLFHVHAQSISDSSKYFFVGYTISQPDKYSYIDTLAITYSINDTITFKVTGGGFGIRTNNNFIKFGNYIYKISGNDTILLYDYTLVEGDTFKFNPNFGIADTLFIVDSVRHITLEDGNNHKHWFLKSTGIDMSYPLVWIENWGESVIGWDWSPFLAFHKPTLKAICKNDATLIYWNQNIDPFTSQTCDFEKLNKMVSTTYHTIDKLTIYPNPASDYLYIDGITSGTYEIVNHMGRKVQTGNVANKVNLEALSIGVYFIRIVHDGGIFSGKFVKE